MQRLGELEVPRTLEEACDPGSLALLVYDMQVGILGQIEDRDRVVERAQVALQAARGAGARRLFVRHVTLPTKLMGAGQLRMWMAWQGVERPQDVRSPFPPGAPHVEVVPELAPLADEAVLDKVTMSAWEGTPLDHVLRDCGVRSVAVLGVALEIGVEPTVRHAADLGYLPIVITDACGAGDAEAGRRSLATLEFLGDAIMTDADAFASALAG